MKTPIKFKDIADNGLSLTKDEAQKLQSHISHLAQHGAEGLNHIEVNGPVMPEQEIGQANQVQESKPLQTTAAHTSTDHGKVEHHAKADKKPGGEKSVEQEKSK